MGKRLSSAAIVLALYVVACALLDAVVVTSVIKFEQVWPEYGGVAALGLFFGQVIGVAFLVVWARVNLVWRSLFASAALLGLAYASAWCSEGEPLASTPWFGVLLCFGGMTSLILVVARLMGFSLLAPGESASTRTRRRNSQFTLWALLSLTTAVAILVATIKLAEWNRGVILPSALLFTIFTGNGVLVLASVLLFQRPAAAATFTIATLVLISPLVTIGAGLMRQSDEHLEFAVLGVIQGLSVASIGIVVRLAGYRLMRVSQSGSADDLPASTLNSEV